MRRLFKKGDVIFRQEEVGDCAYIIERGCVEIYLEENGVETSICLLGEGDIFGEMAIMDSSPRSASVRAIEDCCLSLISEEQLNYRLSEADSFIRLLMNKLVHSVRTEINKKLLHKKALTNMSQKRRAEDQQALKMIQFEREIENGLNNNELLVHYQPIVKMSSGQLTGFEALLRWASPTKGLVHPDVFMEVVEKGNLIVPIGRWVLQKAIEDLSEINKVLNFKPFMTINVSGKQVEDPMFFKTIQENVEKSGCDFSQIKLEITERILIEGEGVANWIKNCQNMGLTVALDDFGTGYSSLASLTQFEVDNFKMDKLFINLLDQGQKNVILVKGLIDIAKGLGILVVAEGVETREQAELLTSLGCDYGQGYFYSRPLFLGDLMAFCQDYMTRQETA